MIQTGTQGFLFPCQVASELVGGILALVILKDSGTILEEGLHTQHTPSQWAFSLRRHKVPCALCLFFLAGKVYGSGDQNCRLQHMLPSREGQRIISKSPISSLLENHTQCIQLAATLITIESGGSVRRGEKPPSPGKM